MSKSKTGKAFEPILFQVLWSRIINVCDEMATVLIKTSFSNVIRENQDYSCSVYDATGRMLAQSSHCTPGHIGSMPVFMRQLLEHYPADELSSGDIFITNDPWIGAGHTPDIFIASPAFSGDKLVGFCVNCAHHIDIGGTMASPDASEVYEEGLIIPILKLYDRGNLNFDLMGLICRNVRMSEKVEGDLRAQVAANHRGLVQLANLIDEYQLDDLESLSDAIISFTEESMRQAISEIPDGIYESVTELESGAANGGMLNIKLQMEVKGSEILADFEGTSKQIDRPINSVYNYTLAYTIFSLKCALRPHIPNNEGCMIPIDLTAPKGSILNATFPAACMWRTSTGLSVVEAIFAALGDAIPQKIMASSGTFPLWLTIMRGKKEDGKAFVAHFNAQGGQGARFDKDGVSTTVFPPNVMNTPIEMAETEAPILCESKRLLRDSGGAGRRRGGLGQEVILRNIGTETIVASVIGGRFFDPAKGLHGGKPGTLGAIFHNGKSLGGSSQISLESQDTLGMVFPGGGGFGDPDERPIEHVVKDIKLGRVSVEKACEQYSLHVEEKTGKFIARNSKSGAGTPETENCVS